MKHILQSSIVEEPDTKPYRIVLHKLNGEKLCTHVEILEMHWDKGKCDRIYHHHSYCYGHYIDDKMRAFQDFAERCAKLKVTPELEWE